MEFRELNQGTQNSNEQLTHPIYKMGDDQPNAGDPSGEVERSVFCQHGLHHGHFPVAGQTVGEARRTLTQLLHIDPDAVAVINGEIVGDDHSIGEEIAMLNFVKKSSVKG